MRTPLVALAVLALSLGAPACAPTPGPREPSPGPREPPPRPREPPPFEEAEATATEPMRVSLVSPELLSLRTHGVEPDGAFDVTVGAMRATVRGDNVTFAETTFARDILRAARTKDGWLFVTEDGLVAHASTFTGSPRRVGEVRRSFRAQTSAGRVALIDERGALFTSAGEGLHAVTTLPAPALGAAFVDAQRGAAALEGGTLVRTSDGGAHWTAVPLGGDAAVDAFARGDADKRELAIVVAPETVRILRADGTLAAAGPDPELLRLPQERVGNVLRAARSRVTSGVILTDGTAFRSEYQRDAKDVLVEVLVTTGPNGTSRRPVTEIAPNAINETYPWGKGLGALAIADPKGPLRATFRLYRSRLGQPFERFANGPVSKAKIVFSDDGEHVGWPGECGVPKRNDPEDVTFPLGASDVVCVLGGPRDLGHTWPTRAGMKELLSAHRDRFLLAAFDGSLYELRGDTGDVKQLARASSEMPVIAASRARDGTLVLVRSNESRVTAEIAPGGGTLRPLPLPRGARQVVFADVDRGLAVGASAAQVFRTLDGGAHWTPVPVPIDGDGSALPLKGALRCDGAGCVVGSSLTVRGWGAFESIADKRLAAEQAPEPAAAPPPTFTVPETNLTCTVTGASAKATSRPASPDVFRLAAVGATAELESGYDATGNHTLLARWFGKDDKGAFAAAMRAAAPTPRGFTYVLRAATRAGMLFERCPEMAMGVGCTVFWARADGGLVELPFPSAISQLDVPKETPLGALPLPDGGALLALWTRAFDEDVGLPIGPTLDRVVRLAPDGTIRGERSFAWRTERSLSESFGVRSYDTRSRLRAVGTFRGEAGLVVADRSNPLQLRFYPLGRDMAAGPVDVPSLTVGRATACRGPTDPAAVTLTVAAMETWSMLIDPGDRTTRSGTRAFVEVSGSSGTCVRRVDAWGTGGHSFSSRWPGNGLEIDATPDGTFKGSVRNSDPPQDVTCVFR
jgi:hypothetical protein